MEPISEIVKNMIFLTYSIVALHGRNYKITNTGLGERKKRNSQDFLKMARHGYVIKSYSQIMADLKVSSNFIWGINAPWKGETYLS